MNMIEKMRKIINISDNKSKLLALSLIITLSIITSYYQAENSYIDDPFSYTDLVLANILKVNGSITSSPFIDSNGYWQKDTNFRYYRLSPAFLLLSIEYITDVNASMLLTTFYLGNLFLPLLCFLLAYKFIKSSIISTIASLSIIFTVPHTDFGHAALGFIYHLLILLLLFNLFKEKDIKITMLIFIIFFSLAMTYYMTEVFTILFFGYFYLILLLFRDFRNISIHNNILKVTLSCYIIFLIIYLEFDYSTLNAYFSSRQASIDTLIEKFSNYYITVTNLINTSRNNENVNDNATLVYANKLIPTLIFMKQVLIFLSSLLLLPIIMKKYMMTKDEYLILYICIVMIMISLSEILIYSSIGGALGNRYIGFLGILVVCFLSYIVVKNTNIIYIKVGIVSFLMILLVLSIYIYYLRNYDEYYTYYKGKDYKQLYAEVSYWLFSRSTNDNTNTVVLTSHQLSALLFANMPYDLQNKIVISPFDKRVVYLLQPQELCKYMIENDGRIIIPTAITSRPLFGELWQERKDGKIVNVLEPSLAIIPLQNNNTCINKIYNDVNTIVYDNNNEILAAIKK